MSDPRITPPQAVAESERLIWGTLLQAVEDAVDALRTAPAPPIAGVRYVAGENPDDYEEGEMPVVLVCPWCGEDAEPQHVYVAEYAHAQTFAEEADAERMLVFDFETDRYDETETEVRYLHTKCDMPFTLPAGWIVEYQ